MPELLTIQHLDDNTVKVGIVHVEQITSSLSDCKPKSEKLSLLTFIEMYYISLGASLWAVLFELRRVR